MTPATEPTEQNDRAIRIDIAKLIADYRRFILRTAIAAALVAAAIGAFYLLLGQTTRTTASLSFRPTFDGAGNGRYPNQMPFGPGDITAASVVDQVFEKNKIQDYCARDAFRAGFFVEERSPALNFLNADYMTRLSDVRVTAIERIRLQAEYQAKRDALPIAYGLVFIQPASCVAIPMTLMGKALSDVLATWSEDGEIRRGVLRLNVDVLTPAVLDVAATQDASLLIRADLLRSGLRRLASNIDDVQKLPGARLIRSSKKTPTFLEIKTKIDDLIRSGIEPLVVSAGVGLGPGALIWVDEALASAVREQGIAQGRAQAYLDALREYSGVPSSPSPAGARLETRPLPAPGSSDVQTLAAQIDRTFIDRIVELSAPNMMFRQEMTRFLVETSMDAVRRQSDVAHYRHLSEALRRTTNSPLTPQQVAERLTAIADTGKVLAKQFNDLYDELSRASLRSGAAMYQVTGAPTVEVLRSFTPKDYVVAVTGTFVVALLVAFGACLLWVRFRPVLVKRA